MESIIEFKPGPEQNALGVLWDGLVHLNNRMTELELEQAKQFKGQVGGCSAWNHPDPLLPHYFFWYATSAYSFLTLFIKTYASNRPSPKTIREEAERVFPQMIVWRHKVGGHFSDVFPFDPKTKQDDSSVTQANSILLLVDFEIDPRNPQRGRFWTHKWFVREVNPAAPCKGDCPAWQWSLTEQHEKVEAYLRKHL